MPAGVPVVRGVNLARGVFHDDDFVFISDELVGSMPGAVLTAADLVVTHRGTVGQVSMIPRRPRYDRYVASTSQVKVRLDPTRAVPEFYYYWFSSERGRRTILERVSTVGVPGLVQPVASVKSLEVPHPPLPEQRAIAEVLGALDDKIAANRKVDEITEDLLAAAFERFTDQAVRDGRLDEIATINAKRVTPQTGGELRYLDIASVGDGNYEPPVVSSWDEAPGRARRGLCAGDVVWSTVRPNRRSHALVLDDDKRLVASTGLAVLTPRDVSSAYLYQTTKTPKFQQYLETVAEGSAYPAVKADRFADAPVSFLSDEDLASFDQIAVPLRDAQHAHLSENEKLAKTRDGLLPLLMSGRLRVKDAEKQIGEVG